MGVYDTISFNCPSCGKEINCQSKSGECCLNDYPANAVPINVAIDANRHAPFECDCGKQWAFSNIPSDVTLIALEVKECTSL